MKFIPGIQKLYRALRQGCVSAASIDRRTLRDIGADPMRLRYLAANRDRTSEEQELWRQAS